MLLSTVVVRLPPAFGTDWKIGQQTLDQRPPQAQAIRVLFSAESVRLEFAEVHLELNP